jgi:outer membrane protein assembly factor BamB
VLLLLLAGLQDGAQIEKWIQGLAHSDIAVREECEAALRKSIDKALPALKKAASEAADPELRARASAIVREFTPGGLIWKVEASIHPIETTPDRIVVTRGRQTAALSPAGKELWTRDGTVAAPSADGGIGYARSGAKFETVTAIDFATGRELWAFSGADWSLPKPAGARVGISDRAGRFTLLEAKTGKRLWERETKEFVTMIAASGDRVVTVGTQGTMRAHEADSGRELWSAATGVRPAEPVEVAGTRVLFRAADRFASPVQLRAWSLDDGKPAWAGAERPFVGWLAAAATVVTHSEGTIEALDLDTGGSKWTAAGAGPRADGERVVAEAGGGLGALDLATGKLLWRSAAAKALHDVRDGLVLGSDGAALVGLAAKTGEVAWRFDAGVEVRWARLAGDRVYFRAFELEKVPAHMSRAPRELKPAFGAVRAK